MSYTPIGWQTGDTITAEKMNKMDNGWSVDSSQLFSESVTTIDDGGAAWGDLAYGTQITAASVVVTFNGTDYNVSGIGGAGPMVYGDFTFTAYPFFIVSAPGSNRIATQSAGTYTISVRTEGIEVSDNFNSAVNNCVDTSTMPMLCVSGTTTYAEMVSAYASGKLLFFRPYPSQMYNYIITEFGGEFVNFIPTSASVQASFVDGVFTVTIIT